MAFTQKSQCRAYLAYLVTRPLLLPISHPGYPSNLTKTAGKAPAPAVSGGTRSLNCLCSIEPESRTLSVSVLSVTSPSSIETVERIELNGGVDGSKCVVQSI